MSFEQSGDDHVNEDVLADTVDSCIPLNKLDAIGSFPQIPKLHPDQIPQVDFLDARRDMRRERPIYVGGRTSRESVAERDFRERTLSAARKLSYDPKMTVLAHHWGRENFGQVGTGFDKSSIGVVVDIPIEADESEDDAAAMASSLREAADTYYDHTGGRSVFLRPYINFQGDLRREREKVELQSKQARALGHLLLRELQSTDVNSRQVGLVVEHLPPATTVSKMRGYMLGAGIQQYEITSSYIDRWSRLTHLSCDVDTTVSPDIFIKAENVLHQNRAVMVNGRVRYVGGVMDKSSEELAESDDGSKMLYITEHMRRRMLEHLPPRAFRGYVPEAGMALTMSTLVNLKGFNKEAKDNESYWLLYAAREAVMKWLDVDSYKVIENTRGLKGPDIEPSDPYLPSNLVEQLESLTYYTDYEVNTSIRGFEAAIRKRGLGALVDFDQGLAYEMYTHVAHEHRQGRLTDEKLDWQQASELLCRVYSYFTDCGGVLHAEDYLDVDDLLVELFGDKNEPEQPRWRPTYIPPTERSVPRKYPRLP